MQELIKLTQQTLNDEQVNTVNARELHEFLGVGRDFSTWFKDRVEQYSFVENEDYILIPQNRGINSGRGGDRKSKDYHISLDMAKELCMVEKNEKGRQARKYFIECEKKLLQVLSPKQSLLLNILTARDDLSRAVAINNYEVGYVQPLENKVEEQAEVITKQKPKITYYDLVLQCEDLVPISHIAKDFGLSAQKLNKILAEEKVQYKDKSGLWMLYAGYLANNYAQTSTHVYTTPDGFHHAKLHLKWTQKGRLFVYDLLKGRGILPVCERE